MKKKNILGALALASCVMLTGCKNKDGKTPEEVVFNVHDIPAATIVGQSLNLDDYVTVLNSSVSYSIEVAEECASFVSVSGHTLTVSGEGLVKLTVKLGELSQEVSFYGYTKVRHDLFQMFKDVRNEYNVYSPDNDEKIMHGEGFVQTNHWDYDEETKTSYPGGFLKFPDHDGVYPYKIVKEGETEKIVAEPEIYSNSYMEYLNDNLSVGVDFSDLVNLSFAHRRYNPKTEKEESADVLTMSGEQAELFAEKSLMAMNGGWSFSVGFLKCTRVDFFIVDVKDVFDLSESFYMAKIYPFVTHKGSEQDIGAYYMTADPTWIGTPAVKEFIANPENIPVGDDAAHEYGIDTFFKEDLAKVRDYVATFEFGWYDIKKKSYLDPNAESYAQFYKEEVEETIFEDAPVGSSKREFTAKGILNSIDGVYEDGLVEDSTKVFTLERDDKAYKLYENTRYESSYGDKTLSLSALGESFNANTLVFEETENIGTKESPIDKHIFSLNPYVGYGFIDGLFKSESGLVSLIGIMDKYLDRFDVRSFFEVEVSFVPSEGHFAASFSLGWDEAGKYAYRVDFDIKQGNENKAALDAFIAALDYEHAE